MITAVKRFSKAEEQPSEAEEALLFWVNQSLHALRFNYALTLACLVRVDLDFVSFLSHKLHLIVQDTFRRGSNQ